MSEELSVIQNKLVEMMEFEGNKVDIIIENREPLFEIYSTGMALGQIKSSIINGERYVQCRKDRVDKNLKNAFVEPLVRNGLKYLSESQLYDFMLEAKTEKCKRFRKWVTDEVLPTIRKTGGYVNNDDLFVDTYLPYADENTKNLFRMNLMVIRQQNKLIEEQKPMVAFAETVSSSADTIDVGQLAKLVHDENIPIGRNRLFDWMRRQGFLRKNNEPYQKYVQDGWFKVIEQPYNTSYGEKLNVKTVVTGKGQVAIIERLRKAFVA